MTREHRVLIVGWDGATFDLIEPYVEQGLMPNLAQLMKHGAYRRLRSVIPTLSPPAWTTFITGKNPGRHGTFDFIRRQPESYEFATHQNQLANLGTLFHWCGRSGKKVGVANVPLTYPPEKVNGFMVSGFGAASQWDFVYPPELKKEILDMGYRIDNPVAYTDNDDEFLAAALETTKIRAKTSLHLMRTKPWDLFMVVFMNIDQILSFMWHHIDESHPRYDSRVSPHYADVSRDLHQYLDGVLGEMMDVAGPETTTIVASDHGMGPLYKEVFLNYWLEEKGYLTQQKQKSTIRLYQKLVRKIGFSRQNIWRHIGRARTQAAKRLLPKRLHVLVPNEHKVVSDVIDWTRTQAYSFGNVGQIYVNLAGREPQGIIEPGEQYEQVVNNLIADLKTFMDPQDGLPVVDQIYRREELYEGPYLDKAPDICIIMRDYGYITQAQRDFAEQVIMQPILDMSGFHRREGIFVIRGPHTNNASYPTGDIVQVTPTVLYAMGLPIPDRMDGKPMLDIFDKAYVGQNPVQHIEDELPVVSDGVSLTPEQERELQKRLKNLGYLG